LAIRRILLSCFAMNRLYKLLFFALVFYSCATSKRASQYAFHQSSLNYVNDTVITQLLFTDWAATISEENIQKILDGSLKLPEKLRVAIIKLDNNFKKS